MDSGSAALHGTERTAAAPQPRGAPKDSETVVRGGESALAHGEAAGEAGPLPAHPALTGATLLGCHSMKAGLPSAHIDRERIARIVEEASRGSKFYQFKVRKEAKIDERIAALRERRARLLEADSNIFSKTKVGVDRTILRALSMRRLDRVYVHIDMDAFFAAVEMKRRPELAALPMAVGGESMLCTANYVARTFGITSAMPGYIARKLCPSIIILPPDGEAYREAAHVVRAVLAKFDPNYISYSLDEASLDITPCITDANGVHYERAEGIARDLRRGVFEASGLTCSAGIASNRRLAKMCSNEQKPDGQFMIPCTEEAILAYMARKEAKKICGVGVVSNKILHDLLGVVTCSDIIRQAPWIHLLLSENQCDFLIRAALGLGNDSEADDEGGSHDHKEAEDAGGRGDLLVALGAPVTATASSDIQKSISASVTFKSTSDVTEHLAILKQTCIRLADDLAGKSLMGRTVSLRMKRDDFEELTRSSSTALYIWTAEELEKCAFKLFEQYRMPTLRLIGVALSNLVERSQQRGRNAIAGPPKGLQPLRCRQITDFTKGCAEDARSPPPGEADVVRCPICEKAINCREGDALGINDHIDACLGDTSCNADYADRPAAPLPPRPAKTRTLDDFFQIKKGSS